MHPWRDARRARARADRWEQVAALRAKEADALRRDRDAYAHALGVQAERIRALQDQHRAQVDTSSPESARLRAEVARLRETVAALDARNDELRRAVTHWESTHSACERARQVVEWQKSLLLDALRRVAAYEEAGA